jgi:hypothetical protein
MVSIGRIRIRPDNSVIGLRSQIMDYGSAEPDPDPKEIFTDPQKKLSLILIKVDGITRLDFRDIDWSRVWLEVFFLKVHKREIFYGSDFEIFTFS